MTMYEKKSLKLAELRREQKDLTAKNVDLKKKWIKKHSDLVNTVKGKQIESDDPFQVFLKEMELDRARR